MSLQLYRPFPVECPAQEHHGDRLCSFCPVCFLFILSSLFSRHPSHTVAPNCPTHIISDSTLRVCVFVWLSLTVLVVCVYENVCFLVPGLCAVNMNILAWKVFLCVCVCVRHALVSH